MEKFVKFFKDVVFPMYEEGDYFQTFSHTIPEIERKLEILHSVYGELKLYDYGIPEHIYATVLVYGDTIYSQELPHYIFFSNYGKKTWQRYRSRIYEDLEKSGLYSKTDINVIMTAISNLSISSNMKSVIGDIRVTRINAVVNEINIYAFFADYGSPEQVHEAMIKSYNEYHDSSMSYAIKTISSKMYSTYCVNRIASLEALSNIPFYYSYHKTFIDFIKGLQTK